MPSSVTLGSPSNWSASGDAPTVWINPNDNSGYYSWHTAVAGSASPDVYGVEPPYSICQKNWHLPTVEQIKNLKKLYKTFSKLKQPPANFIDDAGCLTATNWGCYWGSTAQGSGQGSVLNYYIGGDFLGEDVTDAATLGGLVRCLAKD